MSAADWLPIDPSEHRCDCTATERARGAGCRYCKSDGYRIQCEGCLDGPSLQESGTAEAAEREWDERLFSYFAGDGETFCLDCRPGVHPCATCPRLAGPRDAFCSMHKDRA